MFGTELLKALFGNNAGERNRTRTNMRWYLGPVTKELVEQRIAEGRLEWQDEAPNGVKTQNEWYVQYRETGIEPQDGLAYNNLVMIYICWNGKYITMCIE
jgi:hypothetical protein